MPQLPRQYAEPLPQVEMWLILPGRVSSFSTASFQLAGVNRRPTCHAANEARKPKKVGWVYLLGLTKSVNTMREVFEDCTAYRERLIAALLEEPLHGSDPNLKKHSEMIKKQ